MDHLFIINPAAGKKDSTETLERLLERLPLPRKIVHTAREGDARRMTEAAAALGKPIRIYACGGDGTLNEVVNGAAGHDFLAVTNVPMGTGNDFLKLFGPNYRSIFSNLEALAAGPQAAFDLMDCNGKLGLDVICAGVDARIAAGVHKYKRLKGVSGRWAYLLSLAEQVLVRGICCPMTVSMGADRWTQEPTAILCICNGRHYGGGFMPVAEARMDDGVLHTILVRKVGRAAFAKLFAAYSAGESWKFPQIARVVTAREVRIRSHGEEIVTCLDGECFRSGEVTMRLAEKRVRFFGPRGCSPNATAR